MEVDGLGLLGVWRVRRADSCDVSIPPSQRPVRESEASRAMGRARAGTDMKSARIDPFGVLARTLEAQTQKALIGRPGARVSVRQLVQRC